MTRSKLKLVKGYYLSCALTPLEGLLAPVIVLYYIDYLKLGFADYTAFISTVLVLNLVFEVPLGYLSDRIGRRLSLLVGNFIYAASLGATLAVQSPAQLFTIAVMLSIGQCLASGNLQSIAYEVFSRAGEKERFGSFLARNAAISVSATAVAALLGGILADRSLALPMIADVALLILRLGFGVAVFLLLWGDPHKTRDNPFPNRKRSAALFSLTELRSISDIVLRQSFLAAACAGAICFAVLRASLNFYQPVLAAQDWSGSQIGFLFSVSIFASSFVSRWLMKDREGSIDSGNTAGLLAVALLVSGVGFTLGDSAIGFFLLGFVMHQITRIAIPSFAINAEQAAMPEGYRHRTTAVSLSMVLKSVLASISIGLSGQISGYIELGTNLALLNFAGAAGAGAIFLLYAPKVRKAH